VVAAKFQKQRLAPAVSLLARESLNRYIVNSPARAYSEERNSIRSTRRSCTLYAKFFVSTNSVPRRL
jgi:hypothetical protein